MLRTGPLQLRRAGATPHCSARASHCGASPIVEHGLRVCGPQQSWHVGPVVVARGLQSAGSVVVAHGPAAPRHVGSPRPDQDSNPCPLYWQVDSFFFLIYLFIFIFGCVGSLLLRAGFSLVAASRGYSSLRCVGFSL